MVFDRAHDERKPKIYAFRHLSVSPGRLASSTEYMDLERIGALPALGDRLDDADNILVR